MNVISANPLTRWVAPAAGIFSLVAVATGFAALSPVAPLTPEFPGVLLTPTAFDASLAGSVLAQQTVTFSEPSSLFTGTLRSVVVLNTTGTLDFYYQLANTTPGGPGLGSDIFRLTLEGFTGFGTLPGDTLLVGTRSDGLAGISGTGAFSVGTSPGYSADRDPGIASLGAVGFDFDPSQFLGGPGNVDSGEVSQFLLIRTNARLYELVTTEIISGFGTAVTTGFAPAVPEPATLLAGLVLGSFVAYRDLGRGRRRKSVASVS